MTGDGDLERLLRDAFEAKARGSFPDGQAPPAYPAIHHLTRPLRTHAAATGDADRLHLWAGTGHRHARSGPAAEILESLLP